MKNIKYYVIAIFFITIYSCNKDLTVDTSAKADFELFFEYLKNDYAYRDAHSFTMEELRNKYLSQIENTNTQAKLASILLNIVKNDIKDPHVWLDSNEPFRLANVVETNPKELETKTPIFSEVTVRKNTDFYTSGLITSQPTIGYLYIRNFNYDIGGTNSLGIEDGIKEIDAILQDLIDQNITSMIVDMRSGAGGTNYVPRYIAQRFIDKTATYMIEYYPDGNSFIKKEWKIKPSGTGFRTKKIALLSNGDTASGGEMFLLAMLQRDNLVHIGSRSSGASGNIVSKDLSNGWNFTITNSRTEFPDGTQYFKVGIIPEISIKNDANYNLTHSDDKLIEKAIEKLQ